MLEITPPSCPCLFGADSIAAFVLEMACGAELGTQHTPLEWCGVAARQENICSEQGCAHTFFQAVAVSCMLEVQKQADGLGSSEQKAARLACVLKRLGQEQETQELHVASLQKAEEPQL